MDIDQSPEALKIVHLNICGRINESLGSDHIPIFIELIPPKQDIVTQKIRKLYRTEQLKDPKIRAKYQMRIEELLETTIKYNDPNQIYKTIIDILDQAATETIGIKTPQNTRKNLLSVETRVAVNRARIPYSQAIQEARNGNINRYAELMQEHRRLYKIFKKILKEEQKRTQQEKNIARTVT